MQANSTSNPKPNTNPNPSQTLYYTKHSLVTREELAFDELTDNR